MDYKHASKLFVANGYELAPKNTWLYYVYFDINPVIQPNLFNGMENASNRQDLGMLVKSVGLPKYKIDTKVFNAYNRPHLVQSKIHYEATTISFHDDAANRVRDFWYDYYSYYYRTSDYSTTSNPMINDSFHGETDSMKMNMAHSEMVSPRDQQMTDWGYTIRNSIKPGVGTTNYTLNPMQYINNIYIFSMFNKQYTEYALINPLITSFSHGEHSSSGNETMANTMTIEYESVAYGQGLVSSDSMTGFGTAHYDKTPSPITAAGGGTASLFGVGGAASALGNAGNGLSGILGLARTANKLQGANLGALAKAEGTNMLSNILSGGANPFSSVSLPVPGDLISGVGATNSVTAAAVAKKAKLASSPDYPTPDAFTSLASEVTGVLDSAKKLFK
jgi:hypothetical protein